MSSPVANLIAYLAVCVGLTAVPAVGIVAWRWGEKLVDRRRAAATAGLSGPPLERIAADLRRIDRMSRTLPDNCAATRRRAVELAYDDVLMLACRALEVPNRLAGLPMGWERDVERLRVEACLGAAGLDIR